MIRKVIECDKCGKVLVDIDYKEYGFHFYLFQLCNNCYEEILVLRKKYEKDYEKLTKKAKQMEEDFLENFKAFNERNGE